MTSNPAPGFTECNLHCPVCNRKMHAGNDCKTTYPCVHRVTCSCGFSTTAFGVDCGRNLYALGSSEALEERRKLLEQDRATKEQP